MLILISPAKNLDYESPYQAPRPTQPQLLDQADQLMQGLKQLAPHEVSSLMKISDKLGQLNYDRFQSWSRPFTKANAKPCVMAFNGDVYQGLSANTLSSDDLAFAQKYLCILSGLYGVLRPLDLMQPYRLEMGTAFKNDKGKDLYHFWRDEIVELLNKKLKQLQSDVVVNLASNEYFKAVDKKNLNAELVEPVFKDYKNGDYKIISFYAKKARGLMARFIIEQKVDSVAQLKRFKSEGYAYSKEHSLSHKPVFLRKLA